MKCGSNFPMYMIGNAHLDPVWLWNWREGYQEVKATFRSALDRLNEHNEFIFTAACSCYYKWVEENDSDMFYEIKKRIAEHRWIPVGGMWIQPDMNTPSGESFSRQLLYGQQYFYTRFGSITTIGYNVDSFGHNAMIPHILTKAGMDSYVWMRPSILENSFIPEGPFIWKSINASSVMAYRIFGEYTTAHEMEKKISQLLDFSGKIEKPVMCFYGVGNHGGGPTKENLREIDEFRRNNLQGTYVKYGSPMQYFASLEKCADKLSVWTGELQHHASGCYSACSMIKKKCRLAENALIRMEKFCSLAHVLCNHIANQQTIHQAWENLLFNEFHDILGGCCIPEAMNDASVQLDETMAIAAREENAALQRISWKVNTMKDGFEIRSKEEDRNLWGICGKGTPVIVFNAHPFEVTDTVRIRRTVKLVKDDNGNIIPSQVARTSRINGENDRHDCIFRATVKPFGYRLYWIFKENSEHQCATECEETLSLKNDSISAIVGVEDGCLSRVSVGDKNVISGPIVYKVVDVSHCDTWAHDIFTFDRYIGQFSNENVYVLEDGPVRKIVRSIMKYNNSIIEQNVILYKDSDYVEIKLRMDIHETHKMIRLCIPTVYQDCYAEIPYAHIKRVCSGEEEHCQRWIAIEGEYDGLCIINDGKYSYSCKNGQLELCLANTSAYADHYGQNLRDEYCEYLDQGIQEVRIILYPYKGGNEAALIHQKADVLNCPLESIVETYHDGPLPSSFSAIDIDNTNVDIECFKRAENGTGFILRLNEKVGQNEYVQVDLKFIHRTICSSFDPFEVKTWFLPDNPQEPILEIPITEIF